MNSGVLIFQLLATTNEKNQFICILQIFDPAKCVLVTYISMPKGYKNSKQNATKDMILISSMNFHKKRMLSLSFNCFKVISVHGIKVSKYQMHQVTEL